MRDPIVPVCNIMGVDIAAIDLPYAVAYIEERIDYLRGNYICVANVHTTVMASEDEGYRAIQNSAAMSVPDGGPLSSVGRRRGNTEMQRVAGPDLMCMLLARAGENGLRHYFFGSTDDTLEKLEKQLMTYYSEAEVVGMHSPPFRETIEREDTREIEAINAVDPDIVWVGLGAPKQERWMAAHEGKVNALMIGVGAGFDYLAGNISRAPLWMQRCSMEWFYRLIQEPGRLAKRYFSTNAKFIRDVWIKGK